MSYIIKDDFKKLITLDDLDRITNSNNEIWKSGESSAIEEAASYMRHRYDTDKEFRDVSIHDSAEAYKAGDRVYTSTDPIVFYIALKDVPTTTLLTNAEFWIQNDDRNQKIITTILIIILYENYTRVNGTDIPNWLNIRYDGGDPKQTGGVIGYLKNIQKGTIQASLPLLAEVADGTTQSGNRIAFGTAVDISNRNSSI